METKNAQKVVRIIAGIIFALSVFTLISIITGCVNNSYLGFELCLVFLFSFFGLPILIGIVSSIGLWKYKRWAQILIIITFAIAFIFSLIKTIDMGGWSYIERFPLVGVLIIFSILFIYLFAFNKPIKRVFSER